MEARKLLEVGGGATPLSTTVYDHPNKTGKADKLEFLVSYVYVLWANCAL